MQLQTKIKIKGPHQVKVLSNIKLSEDTWKLTFENKIIAESSKPGQFVSILCEDLTLRRPFSIANSKNNTFEIIYKIKGKGTKYLSSLNSGDLTDIIGPLGKGFNAENKNSLLIGCGVGIAPIIFLSEILNKSAIKYTFMECSQTYLDYAHSDNQIIITEDGSAGLEGRLDKHLENIIKETKPEKIYTCGPNAALKYIIQVAKKYNIQTEVALERDFACGTGVCMGCTVQINRNGKLVNKRICKDGPVFNGCEVLL